MSELHMYKIRWDWAYVVSCKIIRILLGIPSC